MTTEVQEFHSLEYLISSGFQGDNTGIIKALQKNIQVENMGEIPGTLITTAPAFIATRQPSHTNTLFVLLVVFGKKYFLDSICKSGFVFLLQNNLYCRNSSICQIWAHHFGWRKEAVWVQFLVREDLLSSSVCTHRSPPLPAHNFFFDPLVAQTVKSLPAMQQTQVQSLSWEDPMEREMAAHSSILAWKIPQMEEPGRLQSTGSQRVEHD